MQYHKELQQDINDSLELIFMNYKSNIEGCNENYLHITPDLFNIIQEYNYDIGDKKLYHIDRNDIYCINKYDENKSIKLNFLNEYVWDNINPTPQKLFHHDNYINDNGYINNKYNIRNDNNCFVVNKQKGIPMKYLLAHK